MASLGNHEDFVAYYNDYKNKVFNYLMYRLNFDRNICEDLLMEIVLKAYEKFDQFNPKKGSFKSWIFRIAHNHLLNYWRDQKNIVSLDQFEENGLSLINVQVESNASKYFNEESVKKTLQCLSKEHQEVISLRYLNDMSFKEIAFVMEKKEGAVRTHLSRALSQFKKIYNRLYEGGI